MQATYASAQPAFRGGGTPVPPVTGDGILKEDSSGVILMETGDRLLLE